MQAAQPEPQDGFSCIMNLKLTVIAYQDRSFTLLWANDCIIYILKRIYINTLAGKILISTRVIKIQKGVLDEVTPVTSICIVV
jgi:hypothetical protein